MNQHRIVARTIHLLLFVIITAFMATQVILMFPSASSAQTLYAYVQSFNPATGTVVINGGDSRQTTGIPFAFDWGDGTLTFGVFPQGHTYAIT